MRCSGTSTTLDVRPEWSERELRHKVKSADERLGQRGYLADAPPEAWSRIYDRTPPWSSVDDSSDDQENEKEEKQGNPSVVFCGVGILRELMADLENGKGDVLYKVEKPLDQFEVGPGLIAGLIAPPGAGKTAMASQIAFSALENNPELNCYFANAETTFAALLKRELTGRTNVPPKALRFGDLTQGQLSELRIAAGEISKFEGRLQCVSPISCNVKGLYDLAGQCEPGLLIVDYIQKFAGNDRDPRQSVNEVVTALRMMAHEGWGILALSATPRTHGKGGSDHDSNKLNLASFKESGEIEFNLDSAYILRDQGEITPGVRGVRSVHLDCVKNRHGELGDTLPLVFNMPRMRFTARTDAEPSVNRYSEFDDWNDNPFDDGGAA